MTPRPEQAHAAFDLPLDPRDRTGARLRGAFLSPPSTVLSAATLAEVPATVAAAEAAAATGSWVVGGLTYEAGGAWDPAQATRDGEGELARFEVYDSEPVPWPGSAAPASLDWFPSGTFSGHAPAEAIDTVKAHIAAGDVYQVNLTTRLATQSSGALWGVFAGLAAAQPGGYAVFLRAAGVASVSPELFFGFQPGGRLVTQPMKGTAPIDSDPRLLLDSPKERAENLMIVDLLRNDLGRVCRPGSVSVDSLFEVLRLPTVWQLVSTVSGRTLPGVGLGEVFAALFPCGSVTGAPKIRAMEVIGELEGRRRGWYCGALGVIRPGGGAIFNVGIRTVEQRDGWLTCGVGSGIVTDSVPASELAEWRVKARFLGGREPAGLETMLLVDGGFPHLSRHLERLARTEADLGLGIDLAAVAGALDTVAAAHPSGRFRVRLVANARELSTEVAPAPDTVLPVRLGVAAEPLNVDALRQVIVHKTTWRQHYDGVRALAPPGVFDVICHTPDGLVTEATLGNLAFELDGRWVTPAASSCLLPGVERAALLADGTLVEAEVRLTDLERAGAVAFLNATRGWCPAVIVAG